MLAEEMTLERQRELAAKNAEYEARVKAVIDAVVALPDPLRYLAAKLREARPDRAAVLDELDALIASPNLQEARRFGNSLGNEMYAHDWSMCMVANVAGGRTDNPKASLRLAVWWLIRHFTVAGQRQAAPPGKDMINVTPEIQAAALAQVAPAV